MNYQIGHMSVTINYHTGCVMIIMDDYQIGCMCMTIIQDDYQISVCVCISLYVWLLHWMYFTVMWAAYYHHTD